MTALEPGQHDPLDGVTRYWCAPDSSRAMAGMERLDPEQFPGKGWIHEVDVRSLIARAVKRERGNIAESVLGGTAVVLGRPVGYVDDVRADRDREWVAALAAICDESFARNNAAVMTDAVLRVGRYAMPADTFLSWAASLAAARPAEGTAE